VCREDWSATCRPDPVPEEHTTVPSAAAPFAHLPPTALAEGFHLGDHWVLGIAYVGLAFLVGVLALTHSRDRAFSASIAYVGLGALAAVVLSLAGTDALDPERDGKVLERVAELALVVAVFSAGLTIERQVSRRSWVSVALLLCVVMPLTIVAIAVFGKFAMGLSWGAAILLGAVLAPTDPVLAGDVGLSGVGGEVYGEPRLSLHTEAGFNDGLASPFVVLGLFAADRGGTGWLGEWALADLLYAAGGALVLGGAVGAGAAWCMRRACERDLIAPALEGLAGLGLALFLYGATEALGGYGLLAVFAAGFTFRRYEFDHAIHHGLYEGSERVGTILELLVLLLVGSMLTRSGLAAPGIAGWLLAPVVLLVVRPLLVVAISPPGLIDRRGRLFLGFFGVRGVAALFYAAVVSESGVLGAHEQHVVVWTTIVVVVVSILVHGVTAKPLTARLLARA
jgi:NhaP-type Na+/H+ or K+/H+ antiporter